MTLQRLGGFTLPKACFCNTFYEGSLLTRRTLNPVLAVLRSLELLQMYFASPVAPVNDPFGSSTCFVWLYSAAVPTLLKGSRQEKAYFSWPQLSVPVWEVGREGDFQCLRGV